MNQKYAQNRGGLRGRDYVSKFKLPLKILELSVGLVPRRVRVWLLDLSRYTPGVFGLAARYVLFRSLARSCGEVIAVFQGVYFKHLGNASLGDQVSINPMCYIDAAGGLTIGDNVSIAHGVTIMTAEHNFSIKEEFIRDAPVRLEPVNIGNDVWIGAGVKILAGVNIGNRVVIGAGAVVSNDVPSHSVAVGVPARVIKEA